MGEFPGGRILALADGLGGHADGDMASRCVTETIMSASVPDNDVEIPSWLVGRVNAANSALIASCERSGRSMRSTAVVLVISGRNAYWVHTGDSRLYFIHRGELDFLTEDHSVAFRKFKSGEISREMIGMDPDQPCLLRSLGSPERFEPEVGSAYEPLEPGDAFLLCSDGLWEYVLDEEILLDLYKSYNAREWANYLLLRAMERIGGDNDNISLITVMVS